MFALACALLCTAQAVAEEPARVRLLATVGTIAGGEDVDGLKARMLLIAAIARTREPAVLQSYFERLAGR